MYLWPLLLLLLTSFSSHSSVFEQWTDDLGEKVWSFEAICPASSTEEEKSWIKHATPIYQTLLKENLSSLDKLISQTDQINRLETNMILLGHVLKELDQTRTPIDGYCPHYQNHCKEYFAKTVQKRKALLQIKTHLLTQSPLLASSHFDHLMNTVLRHNFSYQKQDPRFLDSLKKAIAETKKVIHERLAHSQNVTNPEKDIQLIEELLMATKGKEIPELVKLYKASCHLENRFLKNKAMSELRSLSINSALLIASLGATSYLVATKHLSMLSRLAPLVTVESAVFTYNIREVIQTKHRCEIIKSHFNDGVALQECEQLLADQMILSTLGLIGSKLSIGQGIVASRMKIQLYQLQKKTILDSFNKAPKFLKQKGLEALIPDLEKIKQNLSPQKISAIFDAHIIGHQGQGAYTSREILEKGRILKRAGITKKQREIILRAGIAGDEARFLNNETILLKAQSVRNQEFAHLAINYDLQYGDIISISRFSENDNRNAIFKVIIRSKDPYSGELRFREAIFKPRFYGDADGWARTPMETFAYELNRILDMDVIPPTVYRKNLGIIFDGTPLSEGAFLYKVPDFNPLSKLPPNAYGLSHEAVLSDNRVLSVLLQNVDAHASNQGLGRHWVDGKTRPVFLDWSASLRRKADVFMDRYYAFGNSDPVTKIRLSTYESLKRLDDSQLQPLVNAYYLSTSEMRGILYRRDQIIKYFDDLSLKQPIFLEE